MRGRLEILACLLVLLPTCWSGCHREQVRLRVASDSAGYRWRPLVSLSHLGVSCEELIFQIEPPVGYARGRLRPLEGFGFRMRTHWNQLVRPVCAMFRELRRRHNEGLTTIRRFELRKKELLTARQRLLELKERLEEALHSYQEAKEGAAPAAEELASARTQAQRIIAEVAHLTGGLSAV